MRLPSPQPATWLLAWSMALLAMLHEDGIRLVVLAAAVTFVAGVLSFRRCVSLLRRSRWLLLAILVAFGWMTPGMPAVGIPGATSDGLQLAMEQVSRLLISISMTTLLLSQLEFRRLLSALRGVAHPLRCLGLDVDRGVIRLALVLEELDRPDRVGSGLAMLDESRVPAVALDPVRITVERLGLIDLGLMAATLGLVIAVPR